MMWNGISQPKPWIYTFILQQINLPERQIHCKGSYFGQVWIND